MSELAFEKWKGLTIPSQLADVLRAAPRVVLPESRAELVALALGGNPDRYEVAYEVPGKGRIVEVEVVRARNGVVANYPEPYMRRRDPDCMVISDELPSDKPRYEDRFQTPFAEVRSEILAWLAAQELIVLPFEAGGSDAGFASLLVCPLNAAFFATGLADLQRMLSASQVSGDFKPRAVIYVAPPFRHTHCDGRQLVVHSRQRELHEVYALNLYPGPSAKKGVYGVLLSLGRQEGWTTVHGSTVQVVTPYDLVVTILHEGASGGGKSEMLELAHREHDGRLLLGENVINRDRRYVMLPRGCELRPVTDDMALCHQKYQQRGDKLIVSDAEDGWFLRVNHIRHYGTDPQLERLCTQPEEPLVFLNMHGVPDATCLIWEHTEDAPGKPCPNPRVILPRRLMPGVVDHPVEVDIRSFGIRTPPCTPDQPSYGIIGLLQILPPALAWIWRLVAPRGFDNPSITASEGLESEGVGSYWPFATGRRVDHANLLLNQVRSTPRTRYILVPNQHIGCWRVGFMPQWIAREYLARRGGATFRREQIEPARCTLLGYALTSMMVEGTNIPPWMLQVQLQREISDVTYDAGAQQLRDFFQRELRVYLDRNGPQLDPLGREIIECCLRDGSLEEYESLLPVEKR